MHILLVNDDGIHAKGIRALAEAGSALGHQITICAPHTERSASSHRITLTEPLYVRPAEFDLPNVTAWSISGTPADCVRLGLYELVNTPVDVVISGINNGHNAGMAVHYSGTVGAAREGALNQLPSIAASISYTAPDSMLRYMARLCIVTAQAYVHTDIPPQTVLNINAPACEPDAVKPPVVAPLSTAAYRDHYERRESPRAGTYFWLSSGGKIESSAGDTDVALLEAGHITYTFIGNPCGNLDPKFVKQFAHIPDHG